MESENKMRFECRQDSDLKAWVVQLEGELDLFSFDQFKKHFESWKEDKEHENLIVDMRKVRYVGSSGWAVLLTQAAIAGSKGGILVVFGLIDRVQRSWNAISGGGRMLPVVPSFQEAVSLVRAKIKSASKPA